MLHQLWIRDRYCIHECFILVQHSPSAVREAPCFAFGRQYGATAQLISGPLGPAKLDRHD